MNAVLAGWAAGYAMAIITTIALVFLALRLTDDGGMLDRWVAREVPRPILAVPIFLGATLLWTMAGLVFGSLYEVGNFAARPGALGSPGWPFLLIVAAVAWFPLPPLLIFARRFWALWCGLTLAFIALFGWLLPLLAAR